MAAIDLRCEGLVDPLGIDGVGPRLSWRMLSDAQGAAQTAYRLLCATDPTLLQEGTADLWDSGRVETDRSRHVRYGGPSLPRGVRCHWTVRVWDEHDVASPWAEPASWTVFDMARDADWQATWITRGGTAPSRDLADDRLRSMEKPRRAQWRS